MTTPKKPGMGKPYKGIRVLTISKLLTFTVFEPKRTDYLLPINGSVLLNVNCSPNSSSFNWFLIYSFILTAFFPAVSTYYPLHQNSRFLYLNLRFPHFSYIIKLLFPLRNPIKLDILIFGGISKSICTWSGHIFASIMFTPFHLHSSLSIAPISNLFSP